LGTSKTVGGGFADTKKKAVLGAPTPCVYVVGRVAQAGG